jgi:hypothetical protein
VKFKAVEPPNERQQFMAAFWQLASLKKDKRVEAASRILAILAAW